jgi:uncharacterized membrane protein YfcA
MTAALLGALIGLVLALTGAGGGILAIPVLVLGLGLPVQLAAPVGLAAVGMASAFGAIVGLRQGIVRYRAAMLMGAFGILSAPIGVWLAHLIPNRPLMAAFALVMAWVAWRMADLSGAQPDTDFKSAPCHVDPAGGRLIWTSSCARAVALTGLLSGLLSGLLGVGGGFVIVPALSRHTDMDIRSVQATSLAVIALVSISGIGAAAWNGAVLWAVAIPFAGGATIALLAGQRLSSQLAPGLLKRAFALLCLAVAALMLLRAAGAI